MEEILHQAEQLEKDYDWARAAESYERALKLPSENDFSRSETYERLGYAFFRAAFQADSDEEFRWTLRQAVAEYEKAKEHYQKLNDRKKTGIVFRCDAMKTYMGYWLASKAPEKKRLLSECWRLTEDSLNALEKAGEAKEYGKTYNQLSTSALLGYCYEWDYQTGKKIIKEVAEHGEAGIKLLSLVDEADELAKTYAKTALSLSIYAYYFLDLDEKESCVRNVQSFWAKAREGSENSARLEILCPVPCSHDLLLGFSSEEALATIEKALEHARKTRDKFIIGSALDWLTYHTGWIRTRIDDYDESAKVVGTMILYAEEARRQYSVISFISPRSDFAWIEEIHSSVSFTSYNRETDLGKKRDILERAITAGRYVLESAMTSEYPYAIDRAHLTLNYNLREFAEFESSREVRRSLLEEALQHGNEGVRIAERLSPLSYWDLGYHRQRVALIKCGLADLTRGSETKKSMLQAAIVELENATELMIKEVSFQPEKKAGYFSPLGILQYSMGNWWNRLYRLSGDRSHLRKAAVAFVEALESYQKGKLTSRVAECYWKIALIHDELDDHMTAAENFCLASESFKTAAEKIPQLRSFYENQALYMQAWSEIENARYHHERQEYTIATENFEKAASIHESLKQWSYLAPNYAAWAQLEQAEELSRKDQDEKAKESLEETARLFDETKVSIRSQIDKIENVDEKQMAYNMLKATENRQEYCEARIAVEEAKILDKKGDHYSSSRKYGLAAEAFGRIGQKQESEREKLEIQFISVLSRAWQKMTLAEAEASPALYVEASEVFEEARDYAPNEKTKMLVLGHSRFCKALEAGTRFADTRDQELHVLAVQHLASASNYYVKAEYQTASEYAKATKLLFDAYAYMDDAEKEKDPEKKAKLYVMTERVLETSAGSYTKAEHPEKREQILKLLEKAKEEQELAASMTEALHAPAIVSATRAFASPTPTQEQAVGSERFEHADIQANLIIRQKELKVGAPLSLEIELVNAGKGPALLIRVNEVIPEGFDLAEKPETCRVEDSYIDMKGKRLGPLKTEELRLIIKPKVQGKFTLKPTILYLDENGKYKSHALDPVTLVVKELGIKGWIKGER